MKLYSNAYDYAIYTLNYYEDKYFISLFAHFKHKTKIYDHFTYTLIIIKKIIMSHLFAFYLHELFYTLLQILHTCSFN